MKWLKKNEKYRLWWLTLETSIENLPLKNNKTANHIISNQSACITLSPASPVLVIELCIFLCGSNTAGKLITCSSNCCTALWARPRLNGPSAVSNCELFGDRLDCTQIYNGCDPLLTGWPLGQLYHLPVLLNSSLIAKWTSLLSSVLRGA